MHWHLATTIFTVYVFWGIFWWLIFYVVRPGKLKNFFKRPQLGVGSRVKLVSKCYTDSDSNPRWGGLRGRIRGVIIDEDTTCYNVLWNDSIQNGYNREERDLQLLSFLDYLWSTVLPTISIRLKCPCCRAKNRYWNKLLECWDKCDFCRGERKVKIFKWFKWIWYMKLKRIR